MATQTLVLHTKKASHTLAAERAVTAEEKATGLMHRETLEADRAMLFPFEPPQRVAMWMRNTLIPLDMLFYDRQGIIVFIHENAEPKSDALIAPDMDVSGVLEVPGGTAKRLGVALGDRIEEGELE